MPSSVDSPVVVHVDFAPGNLGNKMLQYLAALQLADALGSSAISNVAMAEWHIALPPIRQRSPRTIRYESKISGWLDFGDVAVRVAKQRLERVELNIYSSHIANLPSVDRSRTCFPLHADAVGYGPDVLLINVRASEILQAIHSEYTVIPVQFYVELAANTGLRPVFLGQLDGVSEYLNSLRAAFPGAEFVGSQGAVHDFSVIAKSTNVVIAVSTFSWLAGWLSEAQRVHVPLSGFLNPLQYPAVDLVAHGDARFVYYLFPSNQAVVDREIEAAHAALLGKWREIGYDELSRMQDPTRLPALAPLPYRSPIRQSVATLLHRLRLR